MSDGPNAPASSEARFKSPLDGSLRSSGPYLTESEAHRKLYAAELAAHSWRRVPIAARIALCERFLSAYEANLDAHALGVTESMGKPLSQARDEFGGMKTRALAMCAMAEAVLADEAATPALSVSRTIRHEPLGVVLDIAAWNYPLLVAVNVVVPALLAGNAVLLKHAPQTAAVGAQFEAAFLAAGAPAGLMSDFFVDHELAGRVLDTGRLGYVAFTGSVTSGKRVHARAAQTGLLRTGMELGGKDAALILPDVNLEFAIPNLVDAAFYNAGQSCCAVERIYVPRALYARFLDAFVAETKKQLRLGDPRQADVTLGPVVSEGAAERVRAHVEEAVLLGGRLLVGPSDFQVPTLSACYLAPYVVADAPQHSRLMQEETFGPAVGILPYDSADEGIALVNDSVYGLTASIWTEDLVQAALVGSRLDVGTVLANRADYVDPELPWCGVKDSGVGCTLSKYGLLTFTRSKSFYLRQSPQS